MLADRPEADLKTVGRLSVGPRPGVPFKVKLARIGPLQHLRAIAALCVVLYHTSFYTQLYKADPRFLATFGGGFGTFGVLVFFALSGCLMAMQAEKLAGRPMLFIMHRLIRIYPIFWIVCLVRIAVGYWVGEGQFDALVLMLSPVGVRDYPLGVEWSLVYEVAFYVFVCAVLVVRLERWIGLVGLVWLVSIVGHTWVFGGYSPQFTTSLAAIPLSTVCAAFAAGLVVPSLRDRGWFGVSALPFAAFLVALAGFPDLIPYSTIIIGVGCAALVGWAASSAPQDGASSMLGRLGDWSYATYLIHVPILITVGLMATRLGAMGLWFAMIALVLAMTPLFGTLDIALHRRLRLTVDAWDNKRTALVLVPFTAGFLVCMALSIEQHHREARPFEPRVERSETVRETLDRAGWHQDDGLAGNLDTVVRAGGQTYLSGWVNDIPDRLNRSTMLLMLGDGSTVALPEFYRFDLIRTFGLLRSLAPSAFRKSVPDAACPAGSVIQTFAISRRTKTYRPLNTATCPPA